jgi:hypothetical protein
MITILRKSSSLMVSVSVPFGMVEIKYHDEFATSGEQ